MSGDIVDLPALTTEQVLAKLAEDMAYTAPEARAWRANTYLATYPDHSAAIIETVSKAFPGLETREQREARLASEAGAKVIEVTRIELTEEQRKSLTVKDGVQIPPDAHADPFASQQYMELLERREERIRELEAQLAACGVWKSVEDSPPPKDRPILVCSGNWLAEKWLIHRAPRTAVYDHYLEYRYGDRWCAACGHPIEFTHWMDLPLPPPQEKANAR